MGYRQRPKGRFYPAIEEHGIVGDLHSVALVSIDGTIDFMCLPHFDSPTVFASLLDAERGGFFSIAPELQHEGTVHHKQLYLPASNILLTRFLADEGVAEITDFMPVGEVSHIHNLVRSVMSVRGKMRYRMRCEPRPDYGRQPHTVHRCDEGFIFRSQSWSFCLRSNVPCEIDGDAVVATFELGGQERADFRFELMEQEQEMPGAALESIDECLRATEDFWRAWVGQIRYRGRWREMVDRSALVLKLLFSEPHGTMVAAPTFGLPEQIGGVRNWDYRYTWIRDSAFTLFALTRLGLPEETNRFMRWLEALCLDMDGGDGDGPLRVLYRAGDRQPPEEHTLEHLEGYRGSRPVRIGNSAHNQLQLDIYGELIDAIYVFDRHDHAISYDLWTKLRELVEWVCENWQRPDDGIWEARAHRRHYLHSRVMCWVALDRALRLAWAHGFPAPLERWRESRDRIHADVYERFWHPERGCFVQYQGAQRVDASSLLLPIVRFIAFTDPRWLSHLRVIEQDLVEDSLVHRYRLHDDLWQDGLPGQEGTFSMCSFWFVENLARSGQVSKARFYFEKVLGYANHLGLYSEELGYKGEHLGNYPQAFTHLGLITAALAIDEALSREGWRA